MEHLSDSTLTECYWSPPLAHNCQYALAHPCADGKEGLLEGVKSKSNLHVFPSLKLFLSLSLLLQNSCQPVTSCTAVMDASWPETAHSASVRMDSRWERMGVAVEVGTLRQMIGFWWWGGRGVAIRPQGVFSHLSSALFDARHWLQRGQSDFSALFGLNEIHWADCLSCRNQTQTGSCKLDRLFSGNTVYLSRSLCF